MTVRLKRGDRVEFDWVDSDGSTNWQSSEDLDQTRDDSLTLRTLGYFYDETEDRIRVSQSYTPDFPDGSKSQFGHVLTVPKVTVVGRVRRIA